MVGIGVSLVRLVFGGSIGTVQTWSTSLWADLGAPGPEPSQGQLNAFVAASAAAGIDGLNAVAAQAWSSEVTLDHLTGYWYAPNTTKSGAVSTPAQLQVHGANSGALPYYTSIVASLRTGTPGRSGRGRNYLPLLRSGLVGPTGQIPSGNAQAIADAWASVITDLNGVPAQTMNPNGQRIVVASFTKGIPHPITSVVVDTVPDTQHRRVDQLSPAAVATSLV